jgi:hypothetical protein
MTTRECSRSPFESRMQVSLPKKSLLGGTRDAPQLKTASVPWFAGKMCCHFEKQHQVGGDPTLHEIKADLRTYNRFETRSICEPLTGCPIAYFNRAGSHFRRDGARLWTQVQLRNFLRQGRRRERHCGGPRSGHRPEVFSLNCSQSSIGKLQSPARQTAAANARRNRTFADPRS